MSGDGHALDRDADPRARRAGRGGWLLAKLGHLFAKIAEATAAAVVMVLAVWMLVKALAWAIRQAVTHWRTSLTVLAVAAWWHWWSWISLLVVAGTVAMALAAG